jgi:hypothetical protein
MASDDYRQIPKGENIFAIEDAYLWPSWLIGDV